LAQPPTYDRAYSFTSYQALNPSDPLPANQIESELNRIKLTLDAVLENMALIQRDDGELANESVGLDQLDATASVGLNAPTTYWVTGTLYGSGDTVFHEFVLYVATEAHTAGTFATDLADDLWEELADFSATAHASDIITYNNSVSGLAATNVRAALDEIVDEFLPKTGGTMSGAINMGSQQITALAAPTNDAHAANQAYVKSLTIAAVTKTKIIDYTMLAADLGIRIAMHANPDPITLTLLPAATAGDGGWIIVQKTDATTNTVTIEGDGAEAINGALTHTLTEQYESIILRCDGSNWWIISENAIRAMTGDITFSGAKTFSGAVTFSSTVTFSGAIVRAGRQIVVPALNAKVGATAGWVITADTDKSHATLPAGQTASTLIVPICGLEIGDTLTAVSVQGQVESGGNNVTLTLNIGKQTTAVAGNVDSSLGTDNVGTLTADTLISSANLAVTGLTEVLAEGEAVYAILTGTTGAACDIDIISIIATVTRS
jgi:hypothetical protein